MRRGFFTVLLAGLILIAVGCGQLGNSAPSDTEQILPVESFDTENLFLLERMEHAFKADCEEASIALYTSAQVASDGQMGWDTGDQWTLLAQQAGQPFVLFDEYVQYGEVQFWVSDLNPDEVESPESADLEHHIYVMVTTDVGFTLYDYVWDAENICFWKTVSLQPEHQWSTQHSNKYTFPASLSASVQLEISDLQEILAGADLSAASLTFFHGGSEDTFPAGDAIRAKSYLETLGAFTWESYQLPVEWDGTDDYRYQLTIPGATLTAFQTGYADARPLQVKTDRGEGWFILPYIAGEEGEAEQVSWMIYDAFDQWYGEAQTAALYGGEGSPLTAEELDWFESYTVSSWDSYDAERNILFVRASPISCFFTSQYQDPRDMAASEFLWYCPKPDGQEPVDEAEFQLVQTVLDWRGEDGQLLTLEELPTPCQRLPRSHINAILTQYAGITVEEMHTNWKEDVIYVPSTDCFYTFTSDFGPGMFIPRYGEKNGDIVTLWEAPCAESGTSDMLVLQKNGEDWHVLSHCSAPTT